MSCHANLLRTDSILTLLIVLFFSCNPSQKQPIIKDDTLLSSDSATRAENRMRDYLRRRDEVTERRDSIFKLTQIWQNQYINSHQDKSKIAYSNIVHASNGYALEVTTTYVYDSAAFRTWYLPGCDNVVLDQRINFWHNETVIKSFSYVKNMKFDLIKEKRIPRNDFDVIYSISRIDAPSGQDIFEIDGFGCSNGGSQYFGYYTLEGKLLYDIYLDYPHSPGIEHGDRLQMIQNCHLPDSLHSDIPLVEFRVFPPDPNYDTLTSTGIIKK